MSLHTPCSTQHSAKSGSILHNPPPFTVPPWSFWIRNTFPFLPHLGHEFCLQHFLNSLLVLHTFTYFSPTFIPFSLSPFVLSFYLALTFVLLWGCFNTVHPPFDLPLAFYCLCALSCSLFPGPPSIPSSTTSFSSCLHCIRTLGDKITLIFYLSNLMSVGRGHLDDSINTFWIFTLLELKQQYWSSATQSTCWHTKFAFLT